MRTIGFDNERYLFLQSQKINDRINEFGGKLYLEFGGKLFDDYHASRVLPGFQPDSKVRMLNKLKDIAEIVIVISSSDVEKNKRRGDLGITYDVDVLRLIDSFREIGLYVGSVVITKYNAHPSVVLFENKLQSLGIQVYRHYTITDYPANVQLIVSDEGFGKNDYIKTSRSLVVVTAPGPGSGKMAVCLSQLYHEHKRKVKAGYAKFETFPIWNLPLKHPVNLAYEAATADLNDVNMIDPFHLEAYGKTAVNYNRDIEIFPVLKTIFERISGECPYKSPTDMGVNMAGYCITDNQSVINASRQEIIRRFYGVRCALKQGISEQAEVSKLEILMNQLDISPNVERPVVLAATTRAAETNGPAAAIELADGTIVTGKTTDLLGPSSAMLLNALKTLAGIHDDVTLISPTVIEPIQSLKINHFHSKNPRLHMDEVLIALSICAADHSVAKLALEQLKKLKGCQAHSSVILSKVDEDVFKKLGIELTCEAEYQTNKLYHK